MKVTGFKLKQEIKTLELTKEALVQELPGTYAKFPSDTTTRQPGMVLSELMVVEANIALLQTAQAAYNQKNILDNPERSNLAYIIKYEGVLNRLVKLWKEMSKQGAGGTSSRYGLDKDQIYPVSQVDQKVCLGNIKVLSLEAARLQGVIGVANSKEIEIDDKLFPGGANS